MQLTANHRRSRLSDLGLSLRRLNRDRVFAILTILPSLVLLGIFVYGFIGQTFLWSLTDWQGLDASDKSFIGLENYKNLFSHALNFRFRQELVNTFFFTGFFLVGCLTLGFLLAVLLDRNIKGEGIFRTIFLFPMALSFAVTGTIWRWLLNPRGGVNQLPTLFGGEAWSFSWLNNRKAYAFNWHEVPTLTTVLILALFAFILIRQITRRRWLSAIFIGVPMLAFVAWMAADFLTWNEDDPVMHGMFNWQSVPRYAMALLVVGLLLVVVNKLWHGNRRGAFLFAIPTGILLVAYVAGAAERFPNVEYEEQFGFNVALLGVILAAVWQMSGYTMAMYLAGIRGISDDLREAARVDGCSEVQVYTKIILPLLQPITLSAAIVLGHISLKVFDLIFAMAGTDYLPVSVPGVQVYTSMFRSNKFAIGSSIAIVLLVMVAVVIIPYLATALRGEHEV